MVSLKRFIVRVVWLALLLFALAVTVTFLLVGGMLQVVNGAVGVQRPLGTYRVVATDVGMGVAASIPTLPSSVALRGHAVVAMR